MKDFHIAIAAITSIILFVFSLENFSKEIQRITGEKFRKFLGHTTKYSVVGVLIGAVITAFIQSSSATSVIAISLVNAGVLSFKNSVGIILGSNIGTTVTAQLVAFKLTAFAPAFIILGFLLSFIRSRYSVFAKSLFYFGFVFFTLNLISSTLSPLEHDERIINFLTSPQSPLLGVLIGCLITAIVQSSSVTTGLAVIFTQQGLLGLDNAIPILMGANIGTTATALISIINMDIAAKKTALAHFFFNVGGVLLFLPIIYIYGSNFPLFTNDPAIALANFHLIFNLTTSMIFILILKPFTRMIDRIMGEGKMDFERIDLSFLKKDLEFKEIEEQLNNNLVTVFKFVQENYNLVTLSMETNYKGVFEASKKRIEYFDFIKTEYQGFYSHFIGMTNDEEKINNIVKIMGLYEYVFQIHDSVKDLIGIKESMDQNYVELKSDLLLIIRDLAGQTLSFFNSISKNENCLGDHTEVKKLAAELQVDIDRYNKEILRLMSIPGRNDAGAILQIITYTQRLKDKILNFHHLLSKKYQEK